MIVQLFLTFLISLAIFVYFWIGNENKRLPPGPIRIPLLGSIIQLHRAHPLYPHLALATLAKKYGDVMSFGFGMQTAVVVSSFEAMKDVFKRVETNYSRFVFPYVPDRNYGKNLGIIWSQGLIWNEVRSFTKKTLKGFGYGKVQIMDQSVLDSANQLVDCIKMDLLSCKDGTYFVSSHTFAIHVLNVLWNLVGGYKFDPENDLLKKNMECTKQFVGIMGLANPYNLFPFLKVWFPNQVNYPEHLETHQLVHRFTKTLIDDAKVKRSQRLDSEPTSFIEVFLDKIEEQEGNSDTIFTNEQLEIILEDLFLGGSETTGTLLSWAVIFFVLYPEKQLKLRQELFGKISAQNFDLSLIELKKIPYVRATVMEVLRMGNVVPIPAPRCPTKDVPIGDYIIPKNAVLLYNLYPIFNDKKYWIDPENFRPERYLNDNGEIDQNKAERIMTSVFGSGGRVCFGEAIGVDTLFTFVAALVTNFEFNPIPGQEPSLQDLDSGICVCPRNFYVKLTTL